MTKESKLKKIIEKAVENGWIYTTTETLVRWISEKEEKWGSVMNLQSVEGTLFSHSFAKAIWGEAEELSYKGVRIEPDYGWEFHLQQAVISDSPIDYYYKNM